MNMQRGDAAPARGRALTLKARLRAVVRGAHQAPRPMSSLPVLAALGLLGLAGPMAALAQAQGVLAGGTLPVLRGVVGGQAIVNAPVTTATGRSLTIDQRTQRAIIDWKSFNIANGSEVRFNQPGVTSSALNRIYSLDPSVIQGKLSANGQVLLINQNGILFDRGAQVNVQSLVASTLNLSNERFNSGALTTGGRTTPAFEGGYDDSGSTLPARPDGSRPGAIAIGSGGLADAAAPSLRSAQGGSILLVAPKIDNAGGVIASPDGQVILAAGSKAYLALPEEDDLTGLRGLRVEVEAAPDAPLNVSSLIRNAGDISAARGNVTLAALAINQEGRVSASTAIQANGTVFLQARAKDGAQAGSVQLAAGSRTEVMPDAEDKATLPESQRYDDRRGQIVVEARTIESRGTLIAPGGRIALEAADAADPSGARVYLDQGSLTSVAGNWVEVPYADNLLTFKVTSNELKDAPNQKSGLLKGATVTVDLRKGSPLLDLSGYIAAQGRSVGQKTATGGELVVHSSGSLIQRQGATLDASGGGYLYGSGAATTSKLLGADGRIYDIGSAPEALMYATQLDRFEKRYERWGSGVTATYTGLLYGAGGVEAGYAEGKAGGSINLQSAAGMVLDGRLRGGVTVGPRQLAAAPRGATLTIGNYSTTDNDFVPEQLIGHLDIVQRAGDSLGSGFGAGTALSAEQRDHVTLAAEQVAGPAVAQPARGVFEQTAFDTVAINVNGRVRIDEDVRLEGAPGSSLLVRAPQIEVAGDVSLPGGTITLRPTYTQRPASPDLGPDALGVTVRSGATLSTRGSWINNASADGAFVGPALPSGRQNVAADGSTTTTSTLNGGSVTIAATDVSTTLLERGAVLDVGGGGSIDRNRRLTAGNGGSLTIANGLSSASSSDWMHATLDGYAAGTGGKLVLSTPRVEIDAATANGVLPDNTTRLLPELFSDHGFSSITVNTTQGIDVKAGAAIDLQQRNLVVDPVAAVGLATGGDLRTVASVQRLADDLRAPTNLTLATAGAGSVAGSAVLTMAEGARITADPKAKITLSAVDGLQVDGRIAAPGGDIVLKLNAPVNVGAPDLRIGETADLSVAAAFVAKPNANGLTQGSVVDAGSITVEARNAGVVVERGARLNLDGLHTVVEVLDAAGGSVVTRRAVDGNAGTLVVKSQGGVALDGSLSAQRGSAQGAGGSFALELNAPDSQAVAPDERRIVVTQQATAVAPEAGVVDAAVAIDTLRQAGFDKLRLQAENRIAFHGDTTADFARGVRLDAPLIDVRDDARVNLRGATVAIGQSLAPRSETGQFELTERGVAAPVPTRAGSGLLTAEAGEIDLYGSVTVNGVVETRLFSAGDIQLLGRNVLLPAQSGVTAQGAQVGSLTSAGDLTLRAAQVFPSTRTDFTLAVADQPAGSVVPGGSITVASNGATPGDVYSAGGKLTLRADNILQGGTLKAPLGELVLDARSALELAPGSLTSVSAGGLTIPYGTTLAGLSWRYQDGPGSLNLLEAPSAGGKRVTMNGQRIEVRPDATVDLSGGGDVAAIEFVPGSGGSKDTLLKDNTFAIIPKSRLASLPLDADIAAQKDLGFGLLTAAPDRSVYDSLVIGTGAAVPAGEYVLLPGRYALLPGAYLVQLQTGAAYAEMTPGQTVALSNGQTVVAGVRSARGTDVRESRTVGVVVRPGIEAYRESDYTVTGSQYFADLAALQREAAPRLPVDAGKLAIGDVASLTLDGRFLTGAGEVRTATSTHSGRGAEVDIAAQRIAVVDHAGSAGFDPGVLQVEGTQLSALGSSILLGGRRSDTDTGVQIVATASVVEVANSAAGALKAPEVLLAATDLIDVRAGSVIAGSGAAADASAVRPIQAEAGGALVRLSSAAQTTVERGATTDPSHGEIRVAAGARLSADASLLLDATRTTRSQGTLQAGGSDGRGGALSLASSQVSLGETSGVAGVDQGLVLSNTDLARYAALDELAIKGYQGIDLYGAAAVGTSSLGRLSLDAPALRGHALPGTPAPAATIAAKEVAFTNREAAGASAAAAGGGTLNVQAERIVLGAGDKRVDGYAGVTMNATREIAGEGAGATTVAAGWTLGSPRVSLAAGADQRWIAGDLADPAAPVYQALVIGGAGTAAPADAGPGAGGRLRAEGRSVVVDTTVQARAGSIALAAMGPGVGDGVMLRAGAHLDAAGVAKDYNGKVVVANGGHVGLQAANGDVTLAAGSRVTVSADAAGGAAGSLELQARRVDLQGQVAATAATAGAGGTVSLDLQQLDDFSALNRRLAAAGFDGGRALRVRSGDIAVAAGDVVAARRIALAADTGRIDIAGTLDAGGTRGGAVDVWAGQGLGLADGSLVRADGRSTDARASAPVSDGGSVRLSTAAGRLDFAAGATIDVRPGAKGEAGSVTFGVSRDAAQVVGPVALDGTVLGRRDATGAPATIALEATRVYQSSGSVTAAEISTYADDHAAFLAAADPVALLGRLKGDGGAPAVASLRGATEVRSNGDLTVADAWDLTDSRWLANGETGTLTLRAAGNLTIGQAIGLPDDKLPSGGSWNLRLAGGADLTAADPLATRAADASGASGNVVLSGDAAKLRTGTGTIDIAAATDFRMTATQSVVYTAGRVGAPDTAASGDERWSQAGGSISIRAGRDVVGSADPWVTEWLRRPRTSPSVPITAEWWVYRPNFQQGVGTLGGGDIRIAAGRDIDHLSASAPTTGRSSVDAQGARVLDVQGGGDLQVQAGGELRGGSYLVGRGEADIRAGGSVGTAAPVQLFLMGASSGDAPAQATTRIEAGGGVDLQSVNNPTAIYMTNSRGTGPSFGAGGTQVSTFFTYAADSAVDVTAKSGDVTLGTSMAAARTMVPSQPITAAVTDVAAAYPAALQVAAFEGDIRGNPARALITYPSSTAQVALLAQGSVADVNLAPSDRAAASVNDIDHPIRPTSRQLTGDDLRSVGAVSRIVSRPASTGFDYDIQALDGSVLGTGADPMTLNLPGRSRIRAGTDVANVALTLQNLADGDLSEVRAERGDIRPVGVEIRGPGRLLLQAGRNIDLGQSSVISGSSDLGGLVATGNNANASLSSAQSARITAIAGVTAGVDLAKLDASYAELVGLNGRADDILAFYRALNGDPDRGAVQGAASIGELAARDPAYAAYVELGNKYPRVLAVYQATLKSGALPLAASVDATRAGELYALLNRESNAAAITGARGIADLVAALPDGAAYRDFVAFDAKYPRVFADYRTRRANGALPAGLTPIVLSDVLAEVVAAVVPPSAVTAGGISGYQSSIQTYGGSDIDLWAPGGNIVVGLTTPPGNRTIGVVTNAGGAIRSVLGGNFSINQGKVLTAQGGDIVLYTSAGSIDAGRGAKTSISTPPPKRTPVFQQVDGEDVVVGYLYTLPASASGSGIQTLTSDPDGLGPRVAPAAGSVYLFAPGGTIDAGEAGIRSGGNIVLNAQTVLNATNISSAGSSVGVPQVQTGSLASSLAAGGANTTSGSKAAEEASAAAAAAAKAAAAAPVAKLNILSVEVLGFGDRNCKEGDKDCLAK